MMLRTRAIARPKQANWWMFALAFLLGLLIQNAIFAQTKHYFANGHMPPGKVTEATLRTHPEWSGHVQPVKLISPAGATVSYWVGQGFVDAESNEVVVGMQLGPVYRMKVSKIRHYPGVDLYPSIELISRLHPPAGHEQEFPIPILLTQKDLEQAAQGNLVTRVIYLEDPETALPFAKPDNEMQTTDIGGYEDPLRVAEGLGRPMAIVRLGSRQPVAGELQAFAFHGPSTQSVPQPARAEPGASPFQPATETVPPIVSPPELIPVPTRPKVPAIPSDGSNTRASRPVPLRFGDAGNFRNASQSSRAQQ